MFLFVIPMDAWPPDPLPRGRARRSVTVRYRARQAAAFTTAGARTISLRSPYEAVEDLKAILQLWNFWRERIRPIGRTRFELFNNKRSDFEDTRPWSFEPSKGTLKHRCRPRLPDSRHITAVIVIIAIICMYVCMYVCMCIYIYIYI